MTTFTRWLSTIALGGLVASASAAPVPAPATTTTTTTTTTPTADRALERMRARQRTLRTLAASIEQTKSFPQLGIEDPAERGRLYLERGRDGGTRLRLEITVPETRILIVDDDGYLLYQPRIKQAVEGALGGEGAGAKGLFTGILTGSDEAAEALERDYRLVELGPGHLRFDANEGVSMHCKTVELWLDETTGLPRKQSCHEANQSIISITLEDVTIDGELPAKVFEVDVPNDVERVKG